tara:strand:+ start:162 stop:899 length:738 start_codon:yes stop_codon:yes gene_type:complete
MIDFSNVNLNYPLPSDLSRSLRSNLVQNVGGIFTKTNKGKNCVNALKNINLKIEDGCRLGVIGHNGSGKTTLLRAICGVYPPSTGKIKVKGKISALTDITLGMQPYENGINNIIFRLIFMGHSFRVAKSAVEEIVEFSELGNFIHLPVSTYSTGMYLRLAFAIATHFKPDILILDEIIGAGDAAFQKKVQDRIDKIIDSARISIISSHGLDYVSKYCDRVIQLSHGELIADGNSQDVIVSYKKSM